MRLVLEKAAVSRLMDMPPKLRGTLRARHLAIVAAPFEVHANIRPNITPLIGLRHTFRLRQGDWRAVYEVDAEAGVVRVLKIEPRGSVYR